MNKFVSIQFVRKTTFEKSTLLPEYSIKLKLKLSELHLFVENAKILINLIIT